MLISGWVYAPTEIQVLDSEWSVVEKFLRPD
jgi:hypothetical protein